MYQLMAINIFIIIMDLGLLGLECASLYILETTTKPVFYSIKLKLEFAILGRLVQFVGGPRRNNSNRPSLPSIESREKSAGSGLRNPNDQDISEFVDLSKVNGDLTRVPAQYRHRSLSIPRNREDLDLDLEIARLEHVHTLPSQLKVPNGRFD